MPDAHFAIVGCTNGNYKLQQWRKKFCLEHGINFGTAHCNLLPRLDSGPSPRPPLHRGGCHLVDRTGSGRYTRETNPAQRKANFPSAVSGSYRAEDSRQTNVRS